MYYRSSSSRTSTKKFEDRLLRLLSISSPCFCFCHCSQGSRPLDYTVLICLDCTVSALGFKSRVSDFNATPANNYSVTNALCWD